MIDELDLGFDDYDRAPRHRRGQRGGRPGKRRGRSFAAFFLAFILLGILGVGGYFGYGIVKPFFSVEDYTGSGDGSTTVKVSNGDTATDIANSLYRAQVVKSSQAFVNAAKADSRSKSIEVGFYKLHLHMKASLALDAMLARDKNGVLANRVANGITIPEGTITLDVYAKLSKATNIPVSDFVAAAQDPVALGIPSWWFNRTDRKPALKPLSLEGFLYPATYEFEPGLTAKQILEKMVAKFLDVTTQLGFVNAVKNLNISPYEALVAASIAQVEARYPQDMAGVARVLYNRSYKSFACNCLGLDSEVNYWLRISGQKPAASGDLRVSQLHDPKDPYNTHDKPGLPAGPISNPGQDALAGAMNPPKSNYYYFLAIDNQGHTKFATTNAQFCLLTRQAKANGVNISTC
ncbi:MAG: endolytic transglycosylase MltG [Micromonosporaceae bacterium]|nr:endolytic transglycosylase MltG [Micromonosporaceae bacterium]